MSQHKTTSPAVFPFIGITGENTHSHAEEKNKSLLTMGIVEMVRSGLSPLWTKIKPDRFPLSGHFGRIREPREDIAMNQQDNTFIINRLSRVWSGRQECYLLVQVSYTYEEAGDCQIYRLGSITRLDQF